MTPLLLPMSMRRRSVERDRVARRADAVDRVPLRVVPAAAEAHRLALVELGDDAGEDAHQLERAAADDRQVLDLLGGDDPFARARLGLDQLHLRGDGDRLALLADVEPHVDAAIVGRADGDGLLLVRLESARARPSCRTCRGRCRSGCTGRARR